MSKRALSFALIAGLVAACGPWSAVRVAAQPSGSSDLTATPSAEEKIPEVEDALKSFQTRDFDQALKTLEKAVKTHPDLPPASLILAQWFAQANVPAGVRASLERAAYNDKNDPESFLIMGDIAMREGRVTEADLLYSKVKELLDKFTASKKRKELMQPRLLLGLASVMEAHAASTSAQANAEKDKATQDALKAKAQTEWAAAQKLLEDWLKLDPKWMDYSAETKKAAGTMTANVMERVARAMFQQANAAGSLEMLQKAKKADSQMLTPEARLAQFYAAYPDFKNSKKWMEAALRSAPRDLPTLLVATQWALQNDQVDEAKTYVTSALQVDPKSLPALLLRGVVALFQADNADGKKKGDLLHDAETYFENAALTAPSNFAASNNLAVALCEQDDKAKKDQAMAYAEKNVRLAGNNASEAAEAWSTYGWVLYNLGRFNEADQALGKAAQAAGGNLNAETLYYSACVLAKLGKPANASKLLKLAIESKQPFPKRHAAELLYENLGGRWSPDSSKEDKAPAKESATPSKEDAPKASK